jgi:outer membrane immunogenic protein
VTSRLRGFGTIRARSGVVVDNLLLYVTGGFAFAKFDRTASGAFFAGKNGCESFCAEAFEQSRTRWGWTAGVGAEWALWSNWSIKSEFLYARFQRDEQTVFCTVFCETPRNFRFESNDSLWTTRIGLNYRFGDYGKGPVGVRAAY